MIPRLGLFPTPKVAYDAGRLAEKLAKVEDRVLFFCDTSIFDERTDRRIWDAVFSRKGKVVIVPPVYEELKPWLQTHPDHVAARAVTGRSEAIRFGGLDTSDSSKVTATEYYVNLLAQRKQVINLATRSFRSQHGREPDSGELKRIREDLHNRQLGARGYLLAKKGMADSNSPNFYTDEVLVVLAAVACIYHAREVIILTKDEDLQEQLYKLVYVLDTSYRSMLLADRYLAHPESLTTFPMPIALEPLEEAFEIADGAIMIERNDGLEVEVLPARATPIPVHCWVVGQTLSQLTFMAETEMQSVIAAKGRTRGLNTEKLDGRNCHFWLAPLLLPRELRRCAVIAKDQRLVMGSAEVPYLEFLQAINCMEHRKGVVVDDGST
jgi:hypothetical protein